MHGLKQKNEGATITITPPQKSNKKRILFYYAMRL